MRTSAKSLFFNDLMKQFSLFFLNDKVRVQKNAAMPLYEKYADVILPCENKMLREIVVEIAEKYK